MSLSDIVTVSIATSARGITQAGFGTPLIIGYHTAWMNYVREYETLAALIADGITATTPIYKAANAVFAQSPSPTSIKVGRRATVFSQTVDITPTVGGTGYVHSLIVVSPDGTNTTVTYTELLADAVADIVTALQALLNAIADVTATDNTTHVTCAADNNGELFYYNSMTATLQLMDNTADPGLAADMALIDAEDDDWYCALLDSNSEAEIKGLQAYVETLNKIACYHTSDWGVKDVSTTDCVASDMQNSAYEQCVLLYSADHDGYGGAAWGGKMLPTTPGSATWNAKTLVGVTVDSLSATEENTIEGKDCNHYTSIKGFNWTHDGRSPAGVGVFLDIVRGKHWFIARLEEGIVALIGGLPKLPFTDAGGSAIYGVVAAVIQEGQENGYLAYDPEPVITVPLVANISAANKTARTFPDVNFTVTLQGAVHKVTISGVVTAA